MAEDASLHHADEASEQFPQVFAANSEQKASRYRKGNRLLRQPRNGPDAVEDNGAMQRLGSDAVTDLTPAIWSYVHLKDPIKVDIRNT
ncbi:hypothetical protein J6590_076955 [Homalodisca vitripennis]|nr:hypothetical protein J6590_076955 [Homalodisca vitripennis]